MNAIDLRGATRTYGSKARRTATLCLAGVVPFATGAVRIGVELAIAAVRGAARLDGWFATMPDLQVWSILLALGPVACLGGALLGVLTGRWLRFTGAAAVVVVVVGAAGLLAVAVGLRPGI